ncbi:unnamed protein product [Zymoseptoria tritici ST99CH_1A5]|uniref:MARVEL domain-containing protein n=1 Tax=Zymoseptoria tritici ST99CH_1A5 TaxID=1276529 RepID=A0A1Y6LAE3_ZYMTR|nr:unnamed protein product [Zymoseptoria tritici ST99CH_1A5]
MGLIKGGFMRFTQTFIYFLAFLCSAVALGIYAYFLSVLADRDVGIPKYEKAVTGIAGAGVLYTIIAVVLTCCLGGIAFFGFLAILLDIAFVGGFIAIAILTRDGAHSCSGIIRTPLGRGPATSDGAGFDNGVLGSQDNEVTYAVSQRTACRLNKAVFAVSIIGAFLFLVAAAFQVLLVRSHKKEKRYGPSPANNYTSGSAKRNFWQRKKKEPVMARDAEMGSTTSPPLAVPHHDNRPSYETGTTVGGGNGHLTATQIDKVVGADGSHSGYYTQPTGTAANPYTNTAANY